ncbi:hypothetical protein HQ590_11155 [bacterium]|nr:hypothetical protein [bacterium]
MKTSGLSPRVVHCLAAAGVETIGDLRTWSDDQLLRLRHFGVVSLENIKWFFRWAKRIEAQDLRLPHLKAAMGEFLNKQEVFVLQQRYGLTDPLFRPGMRRPTLQEIANTLGGMTRERIRQVEEEGLRNLRSRLCRELTASFERQWVSRIEQRGGVVTSTEVSEWAADPQLGGYQPWGMLLLFSELGQSIHLHFDYFSTLTPKALGVLESAVLELLGQAPAPVDFAAIQQRLAPLATDPHRQLTRLLTVMLDHHPNIAGTLDGCYLLPPKGTEQVVLDIFRSELKPLHFHEVTRLYNNRMQPHSRKGTGYILRVLNLTARAQRVSRAVYELKPV